MMMMYGALNIFLDIGHKLHVASYDYYFLFLQFF